MQPTLDFTIGDQRKLAGQTLAIENNARLVVEARELAVGIARRKGTVCLDCVTNALHEKGYGMHALGNSAGRLLSGDRRFEHTGRTIKSKRPWANSNRIGTYRLREIAA